MDTRWSRWGQRAFRVMLGAAVTASVVSVGLLASRAGSRVSPTEMELAAPGWTQVPYVKPSIDYPRMYAIQTRVETTRAAEISAAETVGAATRAAGWTPGPPAPTVVRAPIRGYERIVPAEGREPYLRAYTLQVVNKWSGYVGSRFFAIFAGCERNSETDAVCEHRQGRLLFMERDPGNLDLIPQWKYFDTPLRLGAIKLKEFTPDKRYFTLEVEGSGSPPVLYVFDMHEQRFISGPGVVDANGTRTVRLVPPGQPTPIIIRPGTPAPTRPGQSPAAIPTPTARP